MSTELKLRRGTTAQHASFTGGVAEVTVDTTRRALVVHDGVTAGGTPVPTKAEVDAVASAATGALQASNNLNDLPNKATARGNLGVFFDSLRVSVASASTVDLTALAPSTAHVLLTGGGTVNNFTVAAGRTYFVTLGAATTFTVSASIDTGNTRNIVGKQGDTLILYATAANTVRVIMHQPRDGWANLNSGNGYQIFPSGMVLQWGSVVNSATPGDPTAVVFPISLSVVRQVCNTADAATASNAAAWVDNQNTTGFNSRCAAANAGSRWIAVGFI